MKGIAAALIAAVVLVGAYLALGGGDFEPSRPPDPCRAQAQEGSGDVAGTLERVGLNALAGTACDLGVSRERLLLALSGEGELGVEGERRAEAFRAGLRKAVDDEERAGRIGGTEAFLLRQAIGVLPVDAILERLFGDGV